MIFAVVSLCVVVGLAAAAPATSPAPGVIPLEKQQPTVIPILSQSEETEANGTYKFSYETANGIKREETSFDKILPKPKGRSHSGGSEESDESDEIHVQQGSYSYTAPDGTLISVRYIADENGFRPVGNHIFTVPPTVVRSGSNSGEKLGRALKSDSSTSSSDVAPKISASPALLAKSKENDGSGLGPSSTTEADATSPSEPAETKTTTEVSEQPSTTEAAQDSKETTATTTESAESETTTRSAKDEKTTTADDATTTENVEVSKEAASTAAPESDATTKQAEESESTDKPTEAPLASTTPEPEVTTAAS